MHVTLLFMGPYQILTKLREKNNYTEARIHRPLTPPSPRSRPINYRLAILGADGNSAGCRLIFHLERVTTGGLDDDGVVWRALELMLQRYAEIGLELLRRLGRFRRLPARVPA